MQTRDSEKQSAEGEEKRNREGISQMTLLDILSINKYYN
jgi:hypothetical protein